MHWMITIVAKELQITVAGHVGTGKTAIAQVIKEILESYGIQVTVEDAFDGRYDESIFRSYCAVQALAKQDLKVHISTHQLRRMSYQDEVLKYQIEMMKHMAIPKEYFKRELGLTDDD